MTEIASFVDVNNGTLSHTGNTTYTTVRTIASTNFVAGAKYLVLARGLLQIDSPTRKPYAKLVWSTTGDISQTEMVYEDNASDFPGANGREWSFGIILDVPNPAENLLIQLKPEVDTFTAELLSWQALFIRLDADLTENTDFYVDTDDDLAAPTALSTTFADFATSTHTFAAGNWLFIPTTRIGMGATVASYEIQIDASGGGITSETILYSSAEREDSDENHVALGLPRVYNLNGSSFTFKVQARQTSGTDMDHSWSQIVAINLDKFDQFKYAYTAGELTFAAADTFEEVQAITPFSPSTAANWALLGFGSFDAASNTVNGGLRMQVGGTTYPYDPTTFAGVDGNGVGDEHVCSTIAKVSFDTASKDIDLDARASSTSEVIEDRVLLGFSLELAAAGGTTINASLENITLTEHLSSVALDKSISAALESILLTENQANADLDKNINGSVESIALTALSSTVQADFDTNVSAAQESIQVNELSASISLGSGISAVLESITLAELPSNITLDKNISSSIEAISVSENAAQITLGSNVAAVLEGITLTEHQAGVVLDVAINAAQESITINQLAAMIGLATDIDAVKENITLTESGATLTLDASISGTQEQISLTTFNFTLTSSISTPNQPGLEYTIPISKMGYTIPVSKIHFTFREED